MRYGNVLSGLVALASIALAPVTATAQDHPAHGDTTREAATPHDSMRHRMMHDTMRHRMMHDTMRHRMMHDTMAHGTVAHAGSQPGHGGHEMWMKELGGGWMLMAMGQVFPVVTIGAPGEDGSPLERTEWYLTQPAVMANLESPGSAVVLRTTLNFEGITQEDGELTFGGWGEGYLDKRHPHTLLHEAMLSLNAWDFLGGAASLSLGKGFAPYGTDDPMARPGLKYPTNHHLSQLLERFVVSGAFLRDGWSVEAGVFGGTEPTGPYDFSNIESFGNSWSARVAKRWGRGWGPSAAWELSASYGDVIEEHDDVEEATRLMNVALRHARTFRESEQYFLVEYSRSWGEDDDDFYSVLGEARLALDRHQPYARVEYATRPEYPRDGAPGSDDFFRYDHDADPIGATRWLITTVAWAYELTDLPFSVRPFVGIQHHFVDAERGGIEPEALFGTDSFWAITAGARIFIGGGPMRMGAYGILDPMSAAMRAPTHEPDMPMPGHGQPHHMR